MYTGRYPYIGTVAAVAGAVSIVVFACYLVTRRRKGIKLAPVNILSAVIVFFTDAPEKSVVVLGDGYWAVIVAEDMLDELKSIIEAAQT